MDSDILSVKITDTEQWYDIRPQILWFARANPEYRKDFMAVLIAIDNKMREASQILVDLRRKPDSAALKQCYDSKVQEANDILEPVQQNLLLMILAKPS